MSSVDVRTLEHSPGELQEVSGPLHHLFRPVSGANWIIGAVGQLQLDVLTERMRAEYQIQVALEPAPYQTARWVRSGDESALKLFLERQRSSMAMDGDERAGFPRQRCLGARSHGGPVAGYQVSRYS
jgi:peptide subunit release factor RF-3